MNYSELDEDQKAVYWTKRGVAIVFILIMIVVLWPLVQISAGERGVVKNWGAVQETVLGEGLHFITPIMQTVDIMNVQTEKREAEAVAYSKDLQTVTTKVALNYHANSETVNKLYQKIGKDYVSRIIDPAIQESIKGSTASFTAQELVEQRERVKEDIKTQLLTRLGGNYITVDDFSIVNLDFSDTFEQAIEAKQKSQQDALKAENDLRRVKLEAEQRVAQAEAEAKAIQIQAQAITQTGGAEYVNLKAVEKWNGQLPTQMIPNGSLPFINLNK
jgi:regulator of protease activity HflC (stomatin/prohibitin superfamily)